MTAAERSSYVPGYENRDVGNVTTYGVTGLTEGVTYYYRAKAYNVTSNSPYSGGHERGDDGRPPALRRCWMRSAAKSVFLGETLQFQVSATPDGKRSGDVDRQQQARRRRILSPPTNWARSCGPAPRRRASTA